MGSVNTKSGAKLPPNPKAVGVNEKGERGKKRWKANIRSHVIEIVTTSNVYNQFLHRPHRIIVPWNSSSWWKQAEEFGFLLISCLSLVSVHPAIFNP